VSSAVSSRKQLSSDFAGNDKRHDDDEGYIARPRKGGTLWMGEDDAAFATEEDKSDKRLVLVSQGSGLLISTVIALGNFVSTDDRFFLELGAELRPLIQSIQKLL
jgi:hypothetical protein